MDVLDCYLADVKIDLPGSTSDVSKVGVGHLSWPINNATHDSDRDAWQMRGLLSDLSADFLEVKQCSPT
jgi:hypothetical protein